MLDNDEIEKNPDMLGDYNVDRVIAAFNKRIKPLLIVFNNEIRENLLVKNPEDRNFFTKQQCELINGVPFNESDQDTLEEVLTPSDMEINFWERRNIDMNYIYDIAEEGWEHFIN